MAKLPQKENLGYLDRRYNGLVKEAKIACERIKTPDVLDLYYLKRKVSLV